VWLTVPNPDSINNRRIKALQSSVIFNHRIAIRSATTWTPSAASFVDLKTAVTDITVP